MASFNGTVVKGNGVTLVRHMKMCPYERFGTPWSASDKDKVLPKQAKMMGIGNENDQVN